jgi:hypothetical protein
MKKTAFQLTLLIGLLFPACKSDAQKWVGPTGVAKIEVIDFHTTHRCKTCLAIEKTARTVVESEFANEVKAGKIVFKTVDVDDEKNIKLAEKFEASGTALFVYNGKTGQALDLTEAGFMYAVNNEAKLKEFLRNAIRKNLLLL